ncbi:hypothetical protein D920_01681 [Enterococcus faecalis 13-SD-W-01]|nr:hypothetical protein D920_01681 [Enterococcus faecalis 13-SD-W-01]
MNFCQTKEKVEKISKHLTVMLLLRRDQKYMLIKTGKSNDPKIKTERREII